MRQAVGSAGPIDILVHNVGERDRRPFAEIEPEDFARLIDVDLVAAHALVKLVVPGMIERGWGRLILVTSIVADLATPGASSYTAAKGGLSALARALASELGATGVTSNALSPGFFATETNAAFLASPAGERIASAARPSAGPNRTRSRAPRCSSPRPRPPTSTATRSPSMAACRRRTWREAPNKRLPLTDIGVVTPE